MNYVYKIYFPAKVKKNIYSHTIVADTKKNRQLMKHDKDKLYKRERKIIPGLSFPDNVIINIYGPGKIMVVVFTEQQPFGIIIHSVYLYEALKNIFEFMWKIAKK